MLYRRQSSYTKKSCNAAKRKYTCVGGPFHDTSLFISNTGSLTFSLKEFTGCYQCNTYDNLAKWIPSCQTLNTPNEI